MSTVTEEAKKDVKVYKTSSEQIAKQLKAWEHEIKLRQFNENCEMCHKAFTDLRVAIAALSNPKEAEYYEKECFRITKDLISFFDINVSTEDLNYIYKHETTKGFAHLWDCIHEYCNDIVCKYEWARQY